MSRQKTQRQPLRLRITAAAETALRAGHPWVFAESLREQNRTGRPGDLAVIYDRRNRFLAIGLYDPDSPIRVRVLQAGEPALIDPEWWSRRLDQAIERRRGLFDEQTTGHRWINGESDGWPGLVLDRYDGTLVLKAYTGAWLPRIRDLAEMIHARLKPERVVLRLSRNIQRTEAALSKDALNHAPSLPAATVHWRDGHLLHGTTPSEAVVFLSFSGGFSLYAARGGAVSAMDLDISAHALAGARRNFALNESIPAIGRCRHDCAQADAFDWLRASPRRQFDLIILDPPSFAKREAERASAIRAYEKLASLSMTHLARGGILVACSCSAHVTAEEFFAAVRRSAAGSKRSFEEVGTTGHAPDHPATFKEANYLKAIYLRFR